MTTYPEELPNNKPHWALQSSSLSLKTKSPSSKKYKDKDKLEDYFHEPENNNWAEADNNTSQTSSDKNQQD